MTLKLNHWIYIIDYIYMKDKTYIQRVGLDLRMTYNNVSLIVSELCRKGIIKKEVSKNNKKIKILKLTEKGKRIAESIRIIIEETQKIDIKM